MEGGREDCIVKEAAISRKFCKYAVYGRGAKKEYRYTQLGETQIALRATTDSSTIFNFQLTNQLSLIFCPVSPVRSGAGFNGRADGFTRVDSARPVADQ